jgi:hypothetical protein
MVRGYAVITRRVLPFIFLADLIVLAALLAGDAAIWWLFPIEWLGRFELFHVAAHFAIFAGVAWLYPAQGRGVWLWLLVLIGGGLIEVAQLTTIRSLNAALLFDSAFDLGVDASGAGSVVVYRAGIMRINRFLGWL